MAARASAAEAVSRACARATAARGASSRSLAADTAFAAVRSVPAARATPGDSQTNAAATHPATARRLVITSRRPEVSDGLAADARGYRRERGVRGGGTHTGQNVQNLPQQEHQCPELADLVGRPSARAGRGVVQDRQVELLALHAGLL